MDLNHIKQCVTLVPDSYIAQAEQSWISRNHIFRQLLEQKKIPEEGWNDNLVKTFLSELSQLDSNNMIGNCGAGEREGRIFSSLVAQRNFGLAHGVGRSGDVTAVQPKAVGSSVLNQLCTKLMLDFIRQVGGRNVNSCIIVPMATGMTLMLCFLALRPVRPKAKYIIWPRIDQKSCFKSMVSAGFEPVIIENKLEGDELRTDVDAIEKAIHELGRENILCIHTTTSCFTPRVPDKLEEVAKLCKERDVPHIVNNAYGLQISKCMHVLQQASRVGRVDAFVQSCDKNVLVPVGGAIVASFNRDDFLNRVAATYAGRASAAPAIDLLITLLQLGQNGLKRLLAERKENFKYMRDELQKVASKYGERVLQTPHNGISLGLTLANVGEGSRDVTELGSMLFTRRVSGSRVVPLDATKTIENFSFRGYGSHCNRYHCPYLTVAVAVGMKRDECDVFIKRFDKVMASLKKKTKQCDPAATSIDEKEMKTEESCCADVQV